jgi:microsomal epoxide hydrolase
MKHSYKISIPQSNIDDLRKRLVNTRWPGEVDNLKWETGTNKSYLKELCDYWQNGFDW